MSRLQAHTDAATKRVLQLARMALFQEHRLGFELSLALTVMQAEGRASPEEVSVLLSGSLDPGQIKRRPNPTAGDTSEDASDSEEEEDSEEEDSEEEEGEEEAVAPSEATTAVGGQTRPSSGAGKAAAGAAEAGRSSGVISPRVAGPVRGPAVVRGRHLLHSLVYVVVLKT